MKIIYVHRTQAKGVEGVHIGEIAKAWRRRGHEVAIVSPVGEQLGEPETVALHPSTFRQRLFRFISNHLPELIFECIELAYNVLLIRQASKRGGAQADLIFERYAIFGIAGALLASRWHKPHIVEVNYTSCSALVRDRSRLLKPLARRLDKFVFSRATALVAVSTALKDHLVAEFAVPLSRIIVLPNAADPEVFDINKVLPPPRYSGVRGKIIGFVGGFYPWHGLDLLLQAFERIANRSPDATLMLVGDGPMRPAIQSQCEARGLGERVILTGRVPHDELPGYISLFHIGVMPDSNDYGSPMKIFEYMSLGKPVVVPDYGPLLDAVEDRREGRVFPARNIGALADCLAALLADDAEHARMSTNARKRILDKHNWLSNADAILTMLPRGNE